MPSKFSKQAGFFGLVEAIKSGDVPLNINPKILEKARKASKLSKKTINEFLTINPSKALSKGK